MNYEEMTNEWLEKLIENKSKRLELSTYLLIPTDEAEIKSTVEEMMKVIFVLEKRKKRLNNMNIDKSIKELRVKMKNALKRKNYDRVMELQAAIAQLEVMKLNED